MILIAIPHKNLTYTGLGRNFQGRGSQLCQECFRNEKKTGARRSHSDRGHTPEGWARCLCVQNKSQLPNLQDDPGYARNLLITDGILGHLLAKGLNPALAEGERDSANWR